MREQEGEGEEVYFSSDDTKMFDHHNALGKGKEKIRQCDETLTGKREDENCEKLNG
ncbi:hypothetical protein HanXRQr2_Chr02g0046731 [Helianthus annuus]|uniref:Uncharacterized protein n=1 Tax=Helianthus annuus TaxID=4232 RepID=A0A9K3JKD4_HELAN|nr:hypothetical protein HanXRQr2_Chr02g0046731 [Helianthus annuus]KAJ0950275.1 hypothetical protein HanPSC8_Chr02g0046331 [Helianthus annuus]